ncbi:pilus assembly protein PilM [Paraglaciecola aquimarina]|uniref:Pilus assembly protein PilM n=1 Tax=Paraglaciecola algarum TaxID=3050085 RepID=A0ABS9D4E2_9ALTE|nr:type IV pilus assembly protein PilM [Paraglaciecola sp. G1-23]MCF2947635.1 pilus assembly protein PilM [Paraglaciecola sp. G1-23]
MMNLFRPKAQQMIGLDIGTRFVKAVVLEKSADNFTLQAYACEPIMGNAFAEREIKDFEAVSHALKKVKLALKNKSKLVAIAVSGSTVLNKVVYMDPGQSDHELESQIELEADSLIPYPLNEVYIDFEELEISNTKNNKVEVLLSAVHKDIVDRRNTLLGEVGYETKIVDVESYALGSAVAQFHPNEADQSTCCINIGATQLQFCVVKNGQVIYTKDHSFGMDTLIKDLSMLFSQERSQIEQQLNENTLPESWKQDSYPMFLANLQQNINRAIQLYISATSAARPKAILICGGAGHLSELTEDLSTDLNISVSAFNPFESMSINEKISQDALDLVSPQLVIAAGLANRSFQPWHI